jgi:mRNA interferase MazF
MITSNMARAGHPSRFAVSHSSLVGRQMGLMTDSVVMTDNLATVFDREIDRIIGHCVDMLPVDIALRHTFDL